MPDGNPKIDLIDQVLAEKPRFHRGETEVKGELATHESYLDARTVSDLAANTEACYGIRSGVARFIYDSVDRGAKTLETGAGISTLMFGLKTAQHTSITPNENEVLAIKEYAARKAIPLGTVRFVIEESDKYLPRCGLEDLDFVLIDGKHAFPWPVIDWFYTADRLKKGGLMVLDDAEIYSVGILKEFMDEDPRWGVYKSFGTKTFAFQKLRDFSSRDVAWHMQPYVMNRLGVSQNVGAPHPLRKRLYRMKRYLLRKLPRGIEKQSP